MKTRDLILLAIAAGQREGRLKSIREIADQLGLSFNSVKEYFAAGNKLTSPLNNGDLVQWEVDKARTLRLRNAVIVRENGAVRVGRWETK